MLNTACRCDVTQLISQISVLTYMAVGIIHDELFATD